VGVRAKSLCYPSCRSRNYCCDQKITHLDSFYRMQSIFLWMNRLISLLSGENSILCQLMSIPCYRHPYLTNPLGLTEGQTSLPRPQQGRFLPPMNPKRQKMMAQRSCQPREFHRQSAIHFLCTSNLSFDRILADMRSIASFLITFVFRLAGSSWHGTDIRRQFAIDLERALQSEEGLLSNTLPFLSNDIDLLRFHIADTLLS
jgi:hypothetical protein